MEKPQNEINLLNQQIQLLEAKKFDLESWKSPTLVFMTRIFGSSSEHVRQIRELKYDYSSWSLRDTSGGVQRTDPVRSRAKEILEAAITELELFGKPGREELPYSGIMDLLRKDLTGKEMDELKSILAQPGKEKREKLKEFFSSKEKNFLTSFVTETLLTLSPQQ